MSQVRILSSRPFFLAAGVVQRLEPEPSKLVTRVRLPSPAPLEIRKGPSGPFPRDGHGARWLPRCAVATTVCGSHGVGSLRGVECRRGASGWPRCGESSRCVEHRAGNIEVVTARVGPLLALCAAPAASRVVLYKNFSLFHYEVMVRSIDADS